ncbi:MAG: 2-iminobutanoate/2-iminopropanoate deaminase [Acidimicrobiaceae bacterium]|jgi:2-iminobutanoate/2-iminopropanoate deaminase|nr:2-iminobutanoate/2-iminopropanoate deaminase [Acidimicrobiaceae bacterium]MDQ1364883.1 2-iminobutanoate/2-iminopropanoate deaminase [Acidimicrobiaceae bacterium]MDQ1370356.1 2-iminobutanoate/2-iminopropanoate deaminase [Acidimicrobiaceae bacterium]MDQ1377247.1 2-iminobutanoate/2-iminopropanoate deaminase [Acidimicrobiaceae bacterium]MDQ1401142.1 2-iminobutanoate/2-iminopropanoate deaminase [Acidimicrobiaceae bacterium]
MSSDAGNAPKPVGPYSPIVQAGDWLVCSGQLGLSGGQLVEGLAAQVTQALANAETLLTSQGASLTDVVKTTVFLTDMADFGPMNEAYAAAFGDHRPARSAFAVAGLPLGAVVEIEVWAFTNSGRSGL